MFPFLQLALSAVSTGLSLFGSHEQSKGEKKQSAALKAEEVSRHQQMILDFQRQRLEVSRNAIITRSMALAAGANQGASGSSSVISGAANPANKAAYQFEGLQQNQTIGEDIFTQRQKYYDAGGQVAFGQSLTSLGGVIGSNAETISKLGSYAFGKLDSLSSAPTTTNSNSSLYSLGPIY